MTLTPAFRAADLITRGFNRLGLMPDGHDLHKLSYDKRHNQKPARITLRPAPQGITTRDFTVPGRGGDIPVRSYARDAGTTGGGLLYLHGGGFVLGGLESCDHLLRDLADRTGLLVVSVDYRLAPEHPFPSGLDDCEDALLWFAKEASTLGVDPGRIAVGGDSAGGNLSAALSLLARDTGGPAICAQILIYPLTDMSMEHGSWRECALPWLTTESAAPVRDAYCGKTDPLSPLISVLRAEDLSGLPPALVQTCEHDTLRDEGIAYAERLEAAGVPVRHTLYLRSPHGFLSVPRCAPNYYQAINEIADELRRRTAA